MPTIANQRPTLPQSQPTLPTVSLDVAAVAESAAVKPVPPVPAPVQSAEVSPHLMAEAAAVHANQETDPDKQFGCVKCKVNFKTVSETVEHFVAKKAAGTGVTIAYHKFFKAFLVFKLMFNTY